MKPATPDPATQPATPVAPDVKAEQPADAKTLSADEQMAAFEEDQKFNDWGHQPC